ncbi:MAG: trigger factor [Chlorobi bacterium]|nr:trigger factor [Chlorobiota bacterium]
METKVNVINDSEHELEVTLGYDEISEEIKEAYKKEGKSISVPGFRKGKVPMHMLKKLYGDAIEYKAAEDIANKKFWDIVKEQNLEPINVPAMVDLDFVRGEKLFFKVRYEVKPVIEVKDYTGLEIEKPIYKIKESDVEKEIELLKKNHATFEDAEKVDGNDFKITIDLQRVDKDGNIIEGQKNENFEVDLSDEKTNPVIAQNAQGKSVGETFDFSFIDEHKHGEETHREEYFYKAEIKKIQKSVLPEENEEFFKKISNDKATNLDEMKKIIYEDYEKYFADQSEKVYQSNLLAKVVENNDFTPPKGYTDSILERLIEAEKENAARYGVKDVNVEALKTNLRPKAEWNAKWQIILESLAAKENIKVDDDELKNLAEEESKTTGISVDKLIKYYKDSHRDLSLLEDKVIDFLKENNKIKEVDPEENKKEKEEEKNEQ